MTKHELVARIEKETHLSHNMVRNVVQRTLDHIRDAVTQGQTVELRNFGTFELQPWRGRIGRNPKAPHEDIMIPPRVVVKFRPGKKMRQEVLQLDPGNY